MDMMLQMIYDNKRRKAQLEEELAAAESVVAAVRKKLRHVVKHGKSLEADYGNGEATLPLAPPDDDEEEEATDEADDREPRITDGMDGPAEPLVPDEWSPDYEVPEELAEADDGMAYGREPVPDESNTLTPEQISAASEKGLSPSEYSEGSKPIRRRKAKATAEE